MSTPSAQVCHQRATYRPEFPQPAHNRPSRSVGIGEYAKAPEGDGYNPVSPGMTVTRPHDAGHPEDCWSLSPVLIYRYNVALEILRVWQIS
jgi:hypothetical protein